MSLPETDQAIAALCPACGLCCNGVLFRDVELQPSDNAQRLRAVGLQLTRKGKKTVFPQPCTFFDGRLCQAYGDRPSRCRSFECGILKGVQQGQLTTKAGLALIKQARTQADRLRALLRKLGDTDEGMALTRRYARAAAAPIDLADDKAVELRAELMRATHELMHLLQREFLV